MSLMMCLMKKPGAVSPRTMRGARFDSVHEAAAPPEIVSMTSVTSSPAFFAKATASATPTMPDAIAIWLTIFVYWPEPASPK